MLNISRRWSPSAGIFVFLRLMKEKIEKYRLLTAQIRALIEGEKDAIAMMANVCAAIHETMGFFWTGFYRVQDGELILGPFQGPVACMHIGFGRGVCGTAWDADVSCVQPPRPSCRSGAQARFR